jgi:hypothetical protein
MRFLVALSVLSLVMPSGAASAQSVFLAFQPLDAQYSLALDKIIMISSSPNQVHIYNPATSSDQTIPLSQTPLGLSLSPDGQHAAVMHNGLVSYVNLQSATVQTFVTGVATGAIVLSTSTIYIFPAFGAGPLLIDLQSGGSTIANLLQTTAARLDPVMNAIYGVTNTSPATLFDINIASGISFLLGPSSGGYPICGNIWFSADGSRLFTGCGTVFHTAGMSYVTSFNGLSGVQNLSASANNIALIPSTPDTEVRIFESQYLNQTGRFVLPNAAHGKWVFFNQDGTAIYVIANAGSSYQLDTVELSNSTPCAAIFASNAPVNFPATGGLGTVAIDAGTNCAFQASVSANWIQLVSGSYGSGNTNLTYIVRPNPSSQSRTAAITLNSGASLTISQAGSSGPTTGLVNLSANPVAADYSRSLDKLVYVSASPNELHLYDPNSQLDSFLSLPAPPLSLSVDPSGLYAAVGHDGWISYVNLQAMTIQQVFPLAARADNLTLPGNGYIYIFPSADPLELFSIQISSGTVSTVLNPSGVGAARFDSSLGDLYVAGAQVSKWDVSQGNPILISENLSSVSTCGNLWLSEDGGRIYTACAAVYGASGLPSADFTPEGSLSMAGSLVWAADARQNGLLAVIPKQAPGSSPQVIDTELQLYSIANFSFARQLTLPSFSVNGTAYSGHGKYVFWNASESNVVILEQADGSAPLLSDYGVYVTPACSYAANTSSLTLAASASSGIAISITASAGCSWSAQSQISWIQLVNSSGTGSGTILLSVSANTGSGVRTGTILLAGQTITISQLPAAAAQANTVALNFATQRTGLTSPSQTVTVTNVGPTTLFFSGITIAGNAAADFLIQSNTCGSTLASGSACTVAIAFRPTASGSRTAYLSFSENNNALSQTVSLSGTAIAYLPTSNGSVGPIPQTGDFDGDGKADFVIWRPSEGNWYILPSSGNPKPFLVQQWGLPGDVPLTADFNGDKRSDFVVWRPSDGTWYVLFSSQASSWPPSMVQQWGLPGDIPVPGDYNGDGKADFAVWRPFEGTWYVLFSSQASSWPPSMVQQWGLPGDIPVPGDYDGDGKTDFAVWRPSTGTWYVIPSSNPAHPMVQQWGFSNDIPVPADFDGDGKTDFAVWRPSEGNWYVLPSSGQPWPFLVQQWGLPGDLPQIGDFFGQGKTSFTVWRPSNASWYVLNPANVAQWPAPSLFAQWGFSNDIPM